MRKCRNCGRTIKRKYSHGLCIHCHKDFKRKKKELKQITKNIHERLRNRKKKRLIDYLLSG